MIPLFKVHYPKGIGKKIEKVFSQGFIGEGRYSRLFEKKFSEYIGNPNCVLLNSCTSAISLALLLCGVQAEDEVISSPMTCMATNEPAYNIGAKLVWSDIDPETGNIDPEDAERKITRKTKAILAVHWAGQPFDISRIIRIAKKHSLKVIEDAAHALDATYKGKKIGNHGDFVCFSFQAVKHLTTVDGGALACKEKKDSQRARLLRWFGIDRETKGNKWSYDIKECGYKFHMNNINAVIGLEQMKHIRNITSCHKYNSAYYDRNITNPKIKKIRRSKDSQTSSWIYSLLVDNRDKFKKYLADNGIASDMVHVRNDKYSVFKKFRADLPNLDYFSSRLINIPSGWWLSKKDLAKIVKVINNY
ncbi:MAG: DegT/DnrJ/EryC1/StrS family aminotransferase [Candidatus Omnitrophica bacterium]|nr:DegT/DnrJ/EryC1/StrS family aminotransferase [Candidatus Omnitrophota bacterium]